MNNSDLIWHLVDLLLQKEKDLNQIALEKVQNDNNRDCHRQNEV